MSVYYISRYVRNVEVDKEGKLPHSDVIQKNLSVQREKLRENKPERKQVRKKQSVSGRYNDNVQNNAQ